MEKFSPLLCWDRYLEVKSECIARKTMSIIQKMTRQSVAAVVFFLTLGFYQPVFMMFSLVAGLLFIPSCSAPGPLSDPGSV